jgi:hypothetical protein
VKNGRNPFSLTHIFCKRSSKRRSHGDWVIWGRYFLTDKKAKKNWYRQGP